MLTATWSSLKSSPVMSEIRERLKKKAEKGKPTLSKKEANRTLKKVELRKLFGKVIVFLLRRKRSVKVVRLDT